MKSLLLLAALQVFTLGTNRQLEEIDNPTGAMIISQDGSRITLQKFSVYGIEIDLDTELQQEQENFEACVMNNGGSEMFCRPTLIGAIQGLAEDKFNAAFEELINQLNSGVTVSNINTFLDGHGVYFLPDVEEEPFTPVPGSGTTP